MLPENIKWENIAVMPKPDRLHEKARSQPFSLEQSYTLSPKPGYFWDWKEVLLIMMPGITTINWGCPKQITLTHKQRCKNIFKNL